MNTKNLKYVVAVAEERSFSKAAKKLFISQPSLSQCINGIEEEIGAKLFDRSTLPLTLTYAGERYLAAAISILDIETRLGHELEDVTDNRRGRLTIGLSPLMGSYVLPIIFPIFKGEFPDVELKLIEGENKQLEELALKGRVDLILINPDPDCELECIKTLVSDVLLAAPINHEIVKLMDVSRDERPAIDLRLIADEPFIFLSPEQGLRKTADEIFRIYGITPNIIFETKSIDIANRLAGEGMAFTMVIEKMIDFNQNDNKAAYFHLDKGPFTWCLSICHCKNMYLSKIMLRFIEIMRQSSASYDQEHFAKGVEYNTPTMLRQEARK